MLANGCHADCAYPAKEATKSGKPRKHYHCAHCPYVHFKTSNVGSHLRFCGRANTAVPAEDEYEMDDEGERGESALVLEFADAQGHVAVPTSASECPKASQSGQFCKWQAKHTQARGQQLNTLDGPMKLEVFYAT